jgi:hypothetical protein
MWVGPVNITYGNMPKFAMDFWFHLGVGTRNLGRQSFFKEMKLFLEHTIPPGRIMQLLKSELSLQNNINPIPLS